jgi:phosphoglycolate phosphatase
MVAAEVFETAIAEVLGRHPEGEVRMSGKTDPQIVLEYFEQMGVAPTGDLVEQVLAKLASSLEREAKAGTLAAQGRTCPGVPELLDNLASTEGVTCSLLTGNIYPNAMLKVSTFGLDRWLVPEAGAYGSDHVDRNRLVPLALERAERCLGQSLDPKQVWVVGDTPRDLACARAGGVNCLLVATGTYSLAELAEAGADAVLADLSDVEMAAKTLLGASWS